MHKNADTFQVLSERKRERGYERMGGQSHMNIKTLFNNSNSFFSDFQVLKHP